ncbi:MAG TPA: hypothetical protein VJ673_18365 [Aromatoleum sp.]|uniref:glycoside hydrolase family 19 protein n=1 Tax=Aromatoleum sp. TaxID=2307007 RepID=UPI002B46E442|nr:hypothetical protein [Aromatoleum sp.]HJV27658.1 hypothetical protein [Aromatoleum sp.]
MSAWEDFLERMAQEIRSRLDGGVPLPAATGEPSTSTPGRVMVCFVNRYMNPLDGVKYKIRFDGQELAGITSEQSHCIELQPRTLRPIQVSVWSRERNAYKALDPVTPLQGQPVLVRKRLNTLKVLGETDEPNSPQTPQPRPQAPRPAPPPGTSPENNQGIHPPTAERDERGNPLFPAERPVPGQITVTQLRTIFPKIQGGAPTDAHLRAVADELNADLAKYKLDTPVRRAHFFGQIKREAGATLSGAAECLNYSADDLKRFSYYKQHPNEAQIDGRTVTTLPNGAKHTKPANQETIANSIYGAQGLGPTLGNVEATDGWRFRGRGMKQLTGRDNYARFTARHQVIWGGNTNFCAQPELVSLMPYAIRSAVFFWLDKKCWRPADDGITDDAIDAVTRIVNAGEIANHKKGVYRDPGKDPVLLRRSYVKLAHAAFI